MSTSHILGIFAHPDDETSGAGGTFSKYAAQGARVTVITATRGERGHLGTGGMVIERRELPKVREQEQRAVAKLLGVAEVQYLGYVDGEVKDAPFDEVVERVLGVLERLRPQAVVTFGPLGISRHDDHITISRAATEAFHRYIQRDGASGAALYYVAIPKDIADRFELGLEGVETQPNVFIDIGPQRTLKVQALRTYRSQQDAQELAQVFESMPEAFECFYQAHPTAADGARKTGFW